MVDTAVVEAVDDSYLSIVHCNRWGVIYNLIAIGIHELVCIILNELLYSALIDKIERRLVYA